MLKCFVRLCLALLLAPQLSWAQRAELVQPVRDCIDRFAEDVEASVDDLATATEFLTRYVCATELARIGEDQARQMREQSRQMCLAYAETADDREMCNLHDDYPDYYVTSMFTEVPADAQAYAARKLLDLRSN